jgi:nucleotide-binding universal stress UspA family protein
MMTTGYDYDSPSYIKAAERQCGDQVRAFLKRVAFDGVRFDTSAVAGFCPDGIYQTAAKQGVDLIITSTHGLTGLQHVLTGSIAEQVVRHASCPVLVVPSHPQTRMGNLAKARERTA